MGRALGINAIMAIAFESVYGTAPVSGFKKVPFVSTAFGKEQGLLASDLLGFGRDPLAPAGDVINAGGDVVVPVDLRYFGFWLKALFGAPVTTELDDDVYSHVFTTASAALPSLSGEVGHPEIPAFSMHKGYVANSLALQLQRSGLVNATIGFIGQDEDEPTSSTATGTPSELELTRFNQFQGSVKRAGAALGNVVSAQLNYANTLESVEVIRADGLIAGADPGLAVLGASLVVRHDSLTLYNQAIAKTPVELEFGLTISATAKLAFTFAAAYLPVPKRPVSGPTGIQATYAVQAARPAVGDPMMTATLVNDVASYA
ncbi:hypothetical protein G3545_14105 [Starkeya sp. ORNL1]|uniref:phage tail tube protein n=1 Tax=Starkeya sp. ORNL1 TaxID=2709380 RepID=UPI001462EF10|nr:phage tail tube protein [Starkeya sp. ORNL1]QJP14677.1 hypothetical protein G3545_14105 [Starkeya sp. ORNL1]